MTGRGLWRTPFAGIVGLVSIALFAAALADHKTVHAAGVQLHGAEEGNGEALFKQACAVCHDGTGDTRAPAATALRRMSPESIVRALESGVMRDQGSGLDAAAKRAVAEFLTGSKIGAEAATSTVGLCSDRGRGFAPAGASWNGWSPDLTNTRFQAAKEAGLTSDDVPRLKLKWAFAFPNTFVANGQPTVVGGWIFVPSANRRVYALDAKSGCQYWSFETDAPVRTAITVATLAGPTPRHVAFFGDGRATAYGIDASTGTLLWKTHIDDHPRSKIMGAPAYFEGRLFVPVTAAEEGLTLNPNYECCTGRGALVALDSATGKQLWKTYTIEEQPRLRGKNSDGIRMWGPSGASIWAAPTVDAARGLVYAATGDNFSRPATAHSDAILAFDMKTGQLRWAKQLTADDVWNNACIAAGSRANCPESAGPDFDIASSPILATLANGKRLLLIGQKSGVAHALDPDRQGEIVWQTHVGRGGIVGGIQFGPAFDGTNMYVAVSDMGFVGNMDRTAARLIVDPKVGGGLHALDAATGKKIWSALPPACPDRPDCSPAQSAAVSVIPGVVFSGSVDGHLRAYATATGSVIWQFDTARDFTTVNGVAANGGSLNGPGPTIVNGTVYVGSGYGMGKSGNVLLAFSVDGQ